MHTPAQVIGENVKTLREHQGMTAEDFGTRLGEILGKPWPRQTVYLLEQGGRRLAAEEVVAIALVFDVPIADLFTPPLSVDAVQVGQRFLPREQLLTQGEKSSAWHHELMVHVGTLRRSFQAFAAVLNAQEIVILNIDNALQGKPPIEVSAEPPYKPARNDHEAAATALWLAQRRNYEQAQKWYEEVRPWYTPEGPQWNVDAEGRLIGERE
jgi:transcriptional regulator with XRE-family HTH domain